MATSVNGIIAKKDGSEDWLSSDNWQTFLSLLKEHGNLIWGRKTYEAVVGWGSHYIDDLKDFELVIVGQQPIDSNNPHISYCHSPQEALSLLESKGYQTALVSGGSTLNTSFAKAGLINEVVINVNPSVLAAGVPLFSVSDYELKLGLTKVTELSSGIVQLRYSVNENLIDKSAQ